MKLFVGEVAEIRLAEGTLSEGPEDRFMDLLIAYPDYGVMYVPHAGYDDWDEVFEPGDEKKIMWFQDGELNGFYLEEVLSINQ